MCLIAIMKPLLENPNEIPMPHIDNAWWWNEDGAGMMFVDGKDNVCVKKNYYTKKKFVQAYKFYRSKNKDSTFIIHLRNASAGSTLDKNNCHPFEIFKDKLAMCHNGTIRSLANKTDIASDSYKFAEMLKTLPENWIEKDGYRQLVNGFLGTTNRAAFLTKDSFYKFGNGWITENDIIYSNDYYKKERVITKDITEENVVTNITDTCTRCWNKTPKTQIPDCENCKKFKQESDDIKEEKTKYCKECGIELNYTSELLSGYCYSCSNRHTKNIYDEGTV